MKSGRDILDAQYKGGRSVIEKADWARDLFEGLRQRCPHVPEEQLVRLFHDRGQSQLELIQGAATFAEYNAAHPLGRKRVKAKRPHLRTVAAPAIATVPSKAAPKMPPAKAAKTAPKAAKKAKPKAARAAPRASKAPARKASMGKAKRRR